jgi:hypothetical protein
LEGIFNLVINRDAATDAYINECQLAIEDIKASERALDTALIEVDNQQDLERKLARAVRSLQKAVAPMLSYIIADGHSGQKQDDIKDNEVSTMKVYLYKKLIDLGIVTMAMVGGMVLMYIKKG